MKNLFIYLLMLILSILLNACRKDPISIFIDEETKSYCCFKSTSCITYRDSATQEIDQVRIEGLKTTGKEVTYQKRNTIYYDELTIDMKHFMYQYFYDNSTHIITCKNYNIDSVNRGIIKPILTINIGWIDKTYIDGASNYVNYHNGNLYEVYENTKYEKFYSSYKIEDKIFPKVKVFLTIFPQNYQIRTYWAKEVGVIRTEYIGHDFYAVRNLINYNVIPDEY